MTCAEVRDLFSDVADARLASGELAAWRAHLGECRDCSREWTGFQRTLDLLHGLPGERAPAGFVDRAMAAAYPQSWARRLVRRLFVPLGLKLPVEAVALVLVAAGAMYLARPASLHETSAIHDSWPRSGASTPPALPGPEAVNPSSAVDTRERAALKASSSEVAAASRSGAPDERSTALSRTAREGTLLSAGRPAVPESAHEGKSAEGSRQAAEGSSQVSDATASRRGPAGARDLASGAGGVPPAPVHVGRLMVEDRDAAVRALGELNARVGATEVGRIPAEDGLVVELDVPRAQYVEFSRGVARLGRWMPVAEPSDTGATVRVRVIVARSPAR